MGRANRPKSTEARFGSLIRSYALFATPCLLPLLAGYQNSNMEVTRCRLSAKVGHLGGVENPRA